MIISRKEQVFVFCLVISFTVHVNRQLNCTWIDHFIDYR